MANPVTFLGRMLLWLWMWPLGLWRSLRHGRKKDTKKLTKAIEAQTKALRSRSGF
jgi:hypothetical protein